MSTITSNITSVDGKRCIWCIMYRPAISRSVIIYRSMVPCYCSSINGQRPRIANAGTFSAISLSTCYGTTSMTVKNGNSATRIDGYHWPPEIRRRIIFAQCMSLQVQFYSLGRTTYRESMISYIIAQFGISTIGENPF